MVDRPQRKAGNGKGAKGNGQGADSASASASASAPTSRRPGRQKSITNIPCRRRRSGPYSYDTESGLTYLEARFVDAFATSVRFNGSEAVRVAGYSPKAANVTAAQLLARPSVRAAIEQRLAQTTVPRSEWEARLTDYIRADISQLADCWVLTEAADGSMVRRIDLVKVGQKGLGHLIARITPTKCGDAIELVDKLRAHDMLGKAAGWLREDHTHFHLPNDLSLYSDSQIAAMRRGEDPGPPALAGQLKTVGAEVAGSVQGQLEPPGAGSTIIETTGGEASQDGTKGAADTQGT